MLYSYVYGAPFLQCYFKEIIALAHGLPVQFASRSLNYAEKNYSNVEREPLSLLFGCGKLKQFLLGAKFNIRNDQQPLGKLLAYNSGVPSTSSARIQRWALKISQFHYVFQYSKGSANVNSDCLSRLPLPETIHECEPYELIFVLDNIDAHIITCDNIREQNDKDKNLVELEHYIKHGTPSCIKNSESSKYKSVLPQLTIVKGCIMFNQSFSSS